MTKTDYFVSGFVPAIALILGVTGLLHLLDVLSKDAFMMVWQSFFLLVRGTVLLAAVLFIRASEAPTLPKRRIVVFKTDEKKNP